MTSTVSSPAGRPATAASPARIEARGRRADAPPEPASSRRTVLTLVGVVVLLLLVAVLANVLREPRSDVDLAPDNPAPAGARAAAQVLAEHGVEVTHVTTTAAALADERADGTLLVVGAERLRPAQLRALADTSADVVLVDLSFGSIEDLTDAISLDAGGARDVHAAECSDPHAQAAGLLATAGPGVVAERADVQVCFPLGEDQAGAYATWEDGGRTWAALPNGYPLSNEGLAREGNAALVFRALGAHEHLTWYVPSPGDPFGTESEPAVQTFFLPAAVVAQLFVLSLAFLFWRGRRLGRVVTEPLPVVVRAGETTRGRGRLYRRAGAHGHAAAALRAGAIGRIAGRIGLSHTAEPGEVVESVATATGRTTGEIEHLLYGPPPVDDAGLVALTQALDTMESEVHHA